VIRGAIVNIVSQSQLTPMSNCPSCGDYLRENIVRGVDGRIQLIDVELCRRPCCSKRPRDKRQSLAAGTHSNGSWVGEVLENVADFLGDLWP
jgi:hypothetical protein